MMNIDYTKFDEHKQEASENEEIALKFLEQKDYEYNFDNLDDKYKNDKNFLLKSIERNKWILPLSNIFNEKEIKILFEKYFEGINEKDKYENIDVNIQDYCEEAALSWASIRGHTEIVELLLQNENIDINIQDKFEYTALIETSKNGHTEIVKLLLQDPDIDVNIQEYGWTALYFALEKGHKDIAKLLLEREDTETRIPFND